MWVLSERIGSDSDAKGGSGPSPVRSAVEAKDRQLGKPLRIDKAVMNQAADYESLGPSSTGVRLSSILLRYLCSQCLLTCLKPC